MCPTGITIHPKQVLVCNEAGIKYCESDMSLWFVLGLIHAQVAVVQNGCRFYREFGWEMCINLEQHSACI